jgi:hypothetical protein
MNALKPARVPQGPPPQRPQDGMENMSRTEWRAWRAQLDARNAEYQSRTPGWTPPGSAVPEPAPNLWERLGDLLPLA